MTTNLIYLRDTAWRYEFQNWSQSSQRQTAKQGDFGEIGEGKKNKT